MPSVCFYFQVHQPYRLRNVAPFSEAEGSDLFCDTANSGILWKVARKCYLPTNNKILELIKRFDGRFKVSYSLSGVAIEQMKQFAPDVLDSFVKLADTGCVEFLAETYYHSLAALRDRDFEGLGRVMEHSCFKMHACMLATRPPLVYWNGTTLEVIREVWRLREAGGPTGWVTSDAGPHVKVLVGADTAAALAEALRAVPGVHEVQAVAAGPDASMDFI